MEGMLHSFTKIDEELFEELEEILIMADVGVATCTKICRAAAAARSRRQGPTDPVARSRICCKEIITEHAGG